MKELLGGALPPLPSPLGSFQRTSGHEGRQKAAHRCDTLISYRLYLNIQKNF